MKQIIGEDADIFLEQVSDNGATIRKAKPMDQCSHCGYFIDNRSPAPGVMGGYSQCVKHGPKDRISPAGWCKYFREGKPGEFGSKPLSQTTKKESGYVDDARASMKGGHDWRKREG